MNSPAPSSSIARWLVPVFIVVFCLAAIYLTTSFAKMPPILKRGIQPADFPRLICLLIIALTLLMVWRDPVHRTEPLNKTTWLTMVFMVAFAALVQIDLFLALGIFAAGLALLWGERRLHLLAITGLILPVSVFFLFDLVFHIRFPRGLLTSLWYG